MEAEYWADDIKNLMTADSMLVVYVIFFSLSKRIKSL